MIVHRVGTPILLVLLLAAAAVAEVAPDSLHAVTFDNGLQLLVLPQPEKPIVQVDVYLSLRGGTHRRELPHLVEHLMFLTSENCPAGSLRDSMQLLATEYNGFTASRNIHTRMRCLSTLLPRLLAVQAEQFGRLRPDEAGLEQERHRVLGEHEFRQEAYTRWALDRRITDMAFEENDADDYLPLRKEAVQAVRLADVDTFLAQWFRPDRMVVLVSGPVESEDVVEAVRGTFGTLPAAQGEPPVAVVSAQPEPRAFVTHSEDEDDMLAVGFRLPYGRPDEVAVVHLTETIMDREDGNPTLYIYGDQAVLIIHVTGHWSRNRADEEGAARALKQFWSETRTVKHRVREDWVFERNRAAHVEDLRERMVQPYRRAVWRAQLLAEKRELPSSIAMAAMVDSLDQEQVEAFFDEQFTAARAFTAFTAGRARRDMVMPGWNRGLRFRINPYLVDRTGTLTLGAADISPVLAATAAAGIGRTGQIVLENGITVHVLPVPRAETVRVGGVRTFPFLAEEAPGRTPGRLVLHDWLANAGYDRKGSEIEPRGDRPGWHVRVDTYPTSLTIRAYGPADRLPDVAAAMHKRLTVDRLNGNAFRSAIDQRRIWSGEFRTIPPRQAQIWLTQQILGPEHALCGWQQPDVKSLADWSLVGANKLHRQLCRTGNLQLVVAGKVDLEAVRAALAPTFSRLRQAEPTVLPPVSDDVFGVQGIVVPNPGADVAVFDFMFPPQRVAAEPALAAVDLLVLARLLETRLSAGVHRADLDSVDIEVVIAPAGASVLPRLRVICQAGDAGRALNLVQAELTQLQDRPPTADEVAVARLQLAGPFAERLMMTRQSCDLLLYLGRFGEIPGDPLGDLCRGGHEAVAARAAELFSADRHAWAVMADVTLPGIRSLGPVMH